MKTNLRARILAVSAAVLVVAASLLAVFVFFRSMAPEDGRQVYDTLTFPAPDSQLSIQVRKWTALPSGGGEQRYGADVVLVSSQGQERLLERLETERTAEYVLTWNEEGALLTCRTPDLQRQLVWPDPPF